MNIRRATSADLVWLVSSMREMDAENGTMYRLVPQSDLAAMMKVAEIISTQFVVIAESEGEPIGFLAAFYGPHPLPEEFYVLQMFLWYVVPEHRGSSAAGRLFNEFNDFGEKKAQWVVATISAKTLINQASLERRGYRLTDLNFVREVA